MSDADRAGSLGEIPTFQKYVDHFGNFLSIAFYPRSINITGQLNSSHTENIDSNHFPRKSYKIHRRYFCWRVRLFSQRLTWISQTVSDSDALIQELRKMSNTSLLPLFPGLLSLGVVVHVKVTSMGQIGQFNHLSECSQMTNDKLNFEC